MNVLLAVCRRPLVLAIACASLLISGACVSHFRHEKLQSDNSLIQLKHGKLGVSFVGEPGGSQTGPPYRLRFTVTAPSGWYSSVSIRSLKIESGSDRLTSLGDITIPVSESGFGQVLTHEIVENEFPQEEPVSLSFVVVISGESGEERSAHSMKFVGEVKSGIVVFKTLTDLT